MLLQQPRVVHLDDLIYNTGLNIMILHSSILSTSSNHTCNIISIERHKSLCLWTNFKLAKLFNIIHQLTPDRGHFFQIYRYVQRWDRSSNLNHTLPCRHRIISIIQLLRWIKDTVDKIKNNILKGLETI
jgi:hypothetical protein